MQSDKKVQILMSTYNGERYLAEQLDSIFRQTWPSLSWCWCGMTDPKDDA